LYTLVSPIVGLLAKRYPVRYITQSSFFLGGSAIFMLGPSQLIELPEKSIAICVFGFILLGINFATVFVPLLPDVIDAIE
jgi:hypothetical protein